MNDSSPLENLQSYQLRKRKQNHDLDELTSIESVVTDDSIPDVHDIQQHNSTTNRQQDLSLITIAEDELLRLDKSFEIGALNAFDKSKEHQILNLVDRISQMQFNAFLTSMEIELTFPNVSSTSGGSGSDKKKKNSETSTGYFNHRQWDDFEEEGHFVNVSRAFQEKEKSIANLVKKLDGIGHGIDSINSIMNSDQESASTPRGGGTMKSQSNHSHNNI